MGREMERRRRSRSLKRLEGREAREVGGDGKQSEAARAEEEMAIDDDEEGAEARRSGTSITGRLGL